MMIMTRNARPLSSYAYRQIINKDLAHRYCNAGVSPDLGTHLNLKQLSNQRLFMQIRSERTSLSSPRCIEAKGKNQVSYHFDVVSCIIPASSQVTGRHVVHQPTMLLPRLEHAEVEHIQDAAVYKHDYHHRMPYQHHIGQHHLCLNGTEISCKRKFDHGKEAMPCLVRSACEKNIQRER